MSFSPLNYNVFDYSLFFVWSNSVCIFIFIDYNSIILCPFAIYCFTIAYFCFIKLFTNYFVSNNFFYYCDIIYKFLPFFYFSLFSWSYNYDTDISNCLLFEILSSYNFLHVLKSYYSSLIFFYLAYISYFSFLFYIKSASLSNLYLLLSYSSL